MAVIPTSTMRIEKPLLQVFRERLLQLVCVFALFCFFNRVGSYFVVEETVSVFYPATAIDVLACLFFGWIGALGVFLGTLATPWNPNDPIGVLAIVGALNAIEGLIPWAVFRIFRDLHTDLRDFRSFLFLLFFGAIANSAVFAIAGNLLLVAGPGNPLSARQVFTWWISDFSAVLLIAVPVLAFSGITRFLGERGDGRAQRTLVNAMEITAAIILLGWFATASIRAYLLESYENEVTSQQRANAALSEHVTTIGKLVLADVPSRAHAIQQLRAELAHLERSVPRQGALPAAVAKLDAAAARWMARPSPASRKDFDAALLDVRSELDTANRGSFDAFAARRARIRTVAVLMDFLLFTILGVALLDLIIGISRPLQALHRGLTALRSGEQSAIEVVPTRFVELDALYATLDETSRALAEREQDLRVQTMRAVEASRHKSEFLAKMSHELRTPLNSIVGFSELLLDPQREIAPERHRTFVENIFRSGKNLLRLINDLLDLAKVEAGRMRFELGDDDVRRVVQNALASSAPLFAQKSQVMLAYLPEQPLILRMDTGRIEQALLNLLANANKFTPERGEIHVTVRACEDSCEIEVRDTGIGISEADQERIFEEFEQGGQGGRADGTGLGLALAKRFVEAHGGRITLRSEPGKGSTFCIVLPRHSGEGARDHSS